ncbi:MAG: hypothetical protein ACREBV_06970, partial [Candidatus Zixiibacteriota bacterium]
MEKCNKKEERDLNLCRFVYLKKSLDNFIPPAVNSWAKEKQRLDSIDELIKTIEFHSQFYENDDLRIFPKSQKELWEEGVEIEEDGGQEHAEIEKNEKYVGSKWGKYLRAPEIFFKILEKGKDKLVPLKSIADVRFGIKTGANEFFYLTEDEIKKRGIEKEFWMHKDEKGNWGPNYVVTSPRECYSLILNPKELQYRVLIINKNKKELKGTNVLKYLLMGERKGFQDRPTCSTRELWYDLGEQKPPDQIWFKAFHDRVVAPINEAGIYSSDRFYAIYFHNKKRGLLPSLALNSTIQHLFVELWGRVVLGQGALDNMTYEAAAMPVLANIKLDASTEKRLAEILREYSKREIGPIFDEVGANITKEVSLDKVKPDRRELD